VYITLDVSEPQRCAVPALLKVLLLLEELRETDYGAVDQQPAHNRHGHGGHGDESAVRE